MAEPVGFDSRRLLFRRLCFRSEETEAQEAEAQEADAETPGRPSWAALALCSVPRTVLSRGPRCPMDRTTLTGGRRGLENLEENACF